jgi:hypothetical protein
MTHPLIDQLRFTRSEFRRSLEGLSEEDATCRVLPANCISWNVGHLAWQEQRYWLHGAQGQLPRPDVNDQFRYGADASTPPLADALSAWEEITTASEPWLDSVTTEALQEFIVRDGKKTDFMFGSLLLRLIYHYWYHAGEIIGLRQAMGHGDLPEYVGDIDELAPYRPE